MKSGNKKAKGMKKNKRGGSRKGSGAKPKYNEPTKTIAFRVPESRMDILKDLVKSKLSEWSNKAKSIL